MSPAVRLLGTIAFRRRDGTVVSADAVPTTKALDLLRLLAARGERRSADYYISVLWPSADREHGRMSLRTALAQLRRVAGPDVVRRSGDFLTLGDVETDIDRLQEAGASAEALSRAGEDLELLRLVSRTERLHGADLVVAISSCDEVFAVRDQLREQRCQLLVEGAAAAARLNRGKTSLEFAQLADDLIPTEASGRALMTAWAALGETRRVVETFERLRARLGDNYGVEPSPVSRALYLQVVAPEEEVTQETVEHHWEVAAEIADAVMHLSDGRPRGGVVWIHGEPGAGRSAVARHAVRMVRESAPFVASSVTLLPEFIRLDCEEAARVRREATDRGTVFLIPVRQPMRDSIPHAHEAYVAVEPLTRGEFHDLLGQLMHGQPSPSLEERLWKVTGGLAGHTRQTVRDLVDRDRLQWMAGRVDLAPPRRVS